MTKQFFFTPGPSALFYTVEEHLKKALKENIPSISHRSKAFESIFSFTVKNIKQLLDIPEDYHIFFTGSATEVWERIIQNCVSNESYHLVNGAFSERFYQIAIDLGKNPLQLKSEPGSCPDINKLLLSEKNELIAITQNETSTGAAFPVEEIYKLRDSFPDQMIAVDVVSSAPYINLDYSKIDTAFFSVQKCFGLPAGLGVWIVSPKCIEKAEFIEKSGYSTGSYHCLTSLKAYAKKNQTPETPNVLTMYLLGKVTEDMLRIGINQIRKDTAYKAAVLYHAINKSTRFSPFVTEEKYQSKTVIVAKSNYPANEVEETLKKSGMIIGKGYGHFKNNHIRMANFPAHSKEQIELLADKILNLEN